MMLNDFRTRSIYAARAPCPGGEGGTESKWKTSSQADAEYLWTESLNAFFYIWILSFSKSIFTLSRRRLHLVIYKSVSRYFVSHLECAFCVVPRAGLDVLIDRDNLILRDRYTDA